MRDFDPPTRDLRLNHFRLNRIPVRLGEPKAGHGGGRGGGCGGGVGRGDRVELQKVTRRRAERVLHLREHLLRLRVFRVVRVLHQNVIFERVRSGVLRVRRRFFML